MHFIRHNSDAEHRLVSVEIVENTNRQRLERHTVEMEGYLRAAVDDEYTFESCYEGGVVKTGYALETTLVQTTRTECEHVLYLNLTGTMLTNTVCFESGISVGRVGLDEGNVGLNFNEAPFQIYFGIQNFKLFIVVCTYNSAIMSVKQLSVVYKQLSVVDKQPSAECKQLSGEIRLALVVSVQRSPFSGQSVL